MLQHRFGRIVAALLAVLTLGSWLSAAAASADLPPTGPPPGDPTRDPNYYAPVSVWVDAVHGTDSNACEQTAPCKTLQLAMIFVGFHRGSTVYLAPGEYDGNWDLDQPIHLVGTGAAPGDVVIRPDNIVLPHPTLPVFNIPDQLGDGNPVSFQNLTVTGAQESSAIDAEGSLTLSHVVLTGNTGAQDGGGLHWYSAKYQLSIDHSVISNNSAGNGGGLSIQGSATIVDSTVAGNHANGPGGHSGGIAASNAFVSGRRLEIARTSIVDNTAVWNDGGLSVRDVAFDLFNSTVARNQASGVSGGGLGVYGVQARLVNDTIAVNGFGTLRPDITAQDHKGAGLAVDAASDVTLTNSIVAGNQAAATPDCWTPVYAVLHDGGNNVIGSNQGCEPAFTNRVNNTLAGTSGAPLDARLQPLDATGGIGPMMAINTLSPAFGHGSAATCSSLLGDVDQRGQSRNTYNRGVCDVGAFDTGSLRTPAPTDVDAFAGPSEITVTWDAPADYKLPITGYVITCLPSCGTQTVSATTRFIYWTPVVPGQQYSFTVAALINDPLAGAPSLPTALVTALAPPGLVSHVVAKAIGTTVDLTWDPPTTGGAVDNYVVLCYPNTSVTGPDGNPATCTSRDGFLPGVGDQPLTTHLHLTNLPLGTPVQFGVLTQNRVGTSLEVRSNSVDILPAPSTPTIALDPADDTGASQYDAITANNVLHLAGTADAGLVVTVKDGSRTVATATADGTGAWTATTTPLGNGRHPLTASATRGGITATSAPINVVVDTSTPGLPTVTAKVRVATATVTWTVPRSVAPIAGYYVTMNQTGQSAPIRQIYVPADQARSATFPALLPATEYSFVVAAINLAGTPGNPGLSASVTTRPSPSITSLSIVRAPSAGGTTMVIRGTDLAGVTEVDFGPWHTAPVSIASDGTWLKVVTPAGSGTVQVRVVNPLGASTSSAGTYFTYQAPIVSSIAPRQAAAGADVTISGARVGYATTVTFGGIGAQFRVVATNSIVATVPAGLPANTPVDVVVADAGASSLVSSATTFTLIP